MASQDESDQMLMSLVNDHQLICEKIRIKNFIEEVLKKLIQLDYQFKNDKIFYLIKIMQRQRDEIMDELDVLNELKKKRKQERKNDLISRKNDLISEKNEIDNYITAALDELNILDCQCLSCKHIKSERILYLIKMKERRRAKIIDEIKIMNRNMPGLLPS